MCAKLSRESFRQHEASDDDPGGAPPAQMALSSLWWAYQVPGQLLATATSTWRQALWLLFRHH
jgi:hypothetical protein